MDFSNTQFVKHTIDGCLKCERKAQHFLYKAFYGKMLAVCMRFASNTDEAKDIFHDGIIKVFNSLNQYEYKGSFEGWVRRIIVNTAIDYIRNKHLTFFSYDENSNKANILEENGDFETEEIEELLSLKTELILRLIQKLSPAYRTVFNLYVIENYKHKDIAKILNISIGTSKSNLAKAKIKLRELFNQHVGSLERRK